MGGAKRTAWTAFAALVAALPAIAHSEPARDLRSARMDISGYAVGGRILLESGDFTRSVASYIGRQKSADDIERARAALEQAYHNLGHCSVKVTLPQLGPQDGVVTFRLAEIPAAEARECLPPRAKERDIGRASPVAGDISTKGSVSVTNAGAASPLSTDPKPGLSKPSAIVAQSGSVGAASAASSETEPVASRPAPSATVDVGRTEPAAAPTFEIRRFLAEGNTLLGQDTIDRLLTPFIGRSKNFGDVQRALETLQGAYQRAGYGGVDVTLPEQELERGEVKFVVIEVKVRKVAIDGNEHFSAENIRRSVPSLREGTTPNSRAIAQSIRLANENPSKQANVLLKGAEQEGQVDATIRVADIDPRRWSLTLDNTGNESTGQVRLGLAYQHSNLFDRDHVLTAQYITSPTNVKDVNVFGIGYKIPFYDRGDSIDLVAGYSNVDSGTVQNLFLVSGQGSVFGIRYNQALPKWRDLEQKLTYGLDYRAYQNQVAPVGSPSNVVPDITVHPLSITYGGSLRLPGQDLSFYLNLARNIPGGNDGSDEDFKKQGARFGVGTASYRLFRGGFNYVWAAKNDLQFRANFSSQYTDDALVSPEQFGIGGADSIRGFNERYSSNDKGYRTTVELYTPDNAKSLGLAEGRLRFLVFYDTGTLRRNFTQPNELHAVSLDSAGLGLRTSYKTYFTARMDYAHVLHDGSGTNPPDSRRNVNKLHFSMAWVW